MIKEALQEKNLVEKNFIIEPEDTSVKLFIDMAIPNEYIMDRTRRGRKIDKKLLKKIHKLIYNDG